MISLEFKQIKKILLAILFFVVLLSVVLYGNFQKNKANSNVNINQLYVQFESPDVVEIKNILPVSDALGKKFTGSGTEEGVQGYLEFSLTNKESDKLQYEIIATKLGVEGKEISDKYIKIYMTSFDNNPLVGYDLNSVPVFHSFPKKGASSKILYTGYLSGNSTERLKLRMWLSDNYRISNNLESFKIDINIRVK